MEITCEREVELKDIERMTQDEDLTNAMVGALVRGQYDPRSVSLHYVSQLAMVGWVRIKAVYRTNPMNNRQAWMRDDVVILQEKDHSLGMWMVIYKRHGKSRKQLTAMLSAHDREEAIHDWRHAWPSHEFLDAYQIDGVEYQDFRAWAKAWSIPHGQVMVPMRFAMKAKVRYQDYDDPELLEFSELLREKEEE